MEEIHLWIPTQQRTELGKCRCGRIVWSDDEEILIPPLGEQTWMHMDCAAEYVHDIKLEDQYNDPYCEGEDEYDPDA